MLIGAAAQDRDEPDQKFKHQAQDLKPRLERLSRSELLLLPFFVRTARGSPRNRRLFPPLDVCWSRMSKSADNPLIYFGRDACVNIRYAVLVLDC